MDQYELIRKWEKEAKKQEEIARDEVDDRYYHAHMAASETYQKCANDLKAMTLNELSN